MAQNDKSFVEQVLFEWDPDVDLSEGSPAQTQVVNRIVRRFEPDAFAMDVPLFIRARLAQSHPELNLEDPEPMADILLKGGEALLDPIVREVRYLQQNQSFANVDILATEEAEALAANQFVEHRKGEFSRGTARVFFSQPRAVTFAASNIVSTTGGLKFYPTVPQSITAEQMMLNNAGSLYYVDVAYIAEKAGKEYNIAKGLLTSIAGMSSAVRVTNLARFRSGLPTETPSDLLSRTEKSLSERSINNMRGAFAKMGTTFSDLLHLQTVGHGDPEMKRDIISGGSLGPVLIYGTDGYTADDGDGDGRSELFYSATAAFTTKIGSVGAVTGFVLTVEGVDYRVTSVESAEGIRIVEWDRKASTLADNLTGMEFYVRREQLTLSKIPGGILEPNGPNGSVVIKPNEVHIGGCMDLLVRGGEPGDEMTATPRVYDESPLMSGTKLETQLAGGPTEVVRDLSLTSANDFKKRKVKPGMTLRIKSAPVAGYYTILHVQPTGTELIVSPAPGAWGEKLIYDIVDEIDVTVDEPKLPKGSGVDLRTILHSRQVLTASGTNWTDLGAANGDVLRITGETPNKGDHIVDAVTGTGGKYLVLKTPMKRTSSTEHWELFTLYGGVELPFLRMTSVGLLDSSKKSTGYDIPYSEPVDCRATEFVNTGVGTTETVGDAVIGIVGTVDISSGLSFGAGPFTLHLSFDGGVPLIYNFSGTLSRDQILAVINAVSPGIGGLVVKDGKEFLALRSSTRWLVLQYALSTASSFFGFSTTYNMDNRQIVSEDMVAWDKVAVEKKSSVYVLTGDNIGFWHLDVLSPGRLLVSWVGEDRKAVFPLPDVRATVRVGTRSLGRTRCYFLSPTSFEVRGAYRPPALPSAGAYAHPPNSVLGSFSEEDEDWAEFRYDVFGDESAYMTFVPDPELNHTVVPASSESPPNNLVVTSGSDMVVSEKLATNLAIPGKYSRGNEVDFYKREVRAGDVVKITYQPVQGTVDLSALTYPTAVQNKTLIFSLENGPNVSVTLTSSSTSVDNLITEINSRLGSTVAYKEDDTDAGKQYLRLEADFAFTLRATGSANAVLGFPTSLDTDNDAAAKGKYTVVSVGYLSGSTCDHMRLQLEAPFLAGQAGNSQHFIIERPGVQRTSSTQMQNQKEGGLYYADVELVSLGPGNEFNIMRDTLLVPRGHKSEGWRLTTLDETLTFSEREQTVLKMGRRFLKPGQTDTPEQATLLSGQYVEFNYEKATLVEQAQAFAQEELERTLNASILVRHLEPNYLYLSASYVGGSSEELLKADILSFIQGLRAEDFLYASDLVGVLQNRHAESVSLPLVMVTVVWKTDRRVIAERSSNKVGAGRVSTFYVGNINLSRSL